jgi:hypothetical protein
MRPQGWENYLKDDLEPAVQDIKIIVGARTAIWKDFL